MNVENDVVLDPRGAAFYPSEGVLAVSDLHVGYEASLRERGTAVPRHELDALLPVLDALLDAHRPDVVVVTGDVKHSFERRLLDEARGVREVWRRLTARARVVLVEGNHDRMLRALLPDADVVPSYRAGRRVFAHGHSRAGVAASARDDLVLGHEHPALALRDAVGATVRTRAFLHRARTTRRGSVLVLPALAPWAAGYDVLRPGKFLGPLLARHDRGRYRALALAGDAVLDFGEIRRLSALTR